MADQLSPPMIQIDQAETDPVIAEELSKRFGDFIAVDRGSFRIHSGEVFGWGCSGIWGGKGAGDAMGTTGCTTGVSSVGFSADKSGEISDWGCGFSDVSDKYGFGLI